MEWDLGSTFFCDGDGKKDPNAMEIWRSEYDDAEENDLGEQHHHDYYQHSRRHHSRHQHHVDHEEGEEEEGQTLSLKDRSNAHVSEVIAPHVRSSDESPHPRALQTHGKNEQSRKRESRGHASVISADLDPPQYDIRKRPSDELERLGWYDYAYTTASDSSLPKSDGRMKKKKKTKTGKTRSTDILEEQEGVGSSISLKSMSLTLSTTSSCSLSLPRRETKGVQLRSIDAEFEDLLAKSEYPLKAITTSCIRNSDLDEIASILRFFCLRFSRRVAHFFLSKGCQSYSKDDRFVIEECHRVFSDFAEPVETLEDMLLSSDGSKWLEFLTKFVNFCRDLHEL
eukprot:TRINITY_DN82349_c0_g1_i1.p1 TRINITY_DN82349_c0_g1~~TRINITY_DN82349_c0_g1_i1.p1  ORF type:complete len:340 (+),score=107.18 TRINITY_DN82349_c0_g1_i1:39-1058(+)